MAHVPRHTRKLTVGDYAASLRAGSVTEYLPKIISALGDAGKTLAELVGITGGSGSTVLAVIRSQPRLFHELDGKFYRIARQSPAPAA